MGLSSLSNSEILRIWKIYTIYIFHQILMFNAVLFSFGYLKGLLVVLSIFLLTTLGLCCLIPLTMFNISAILWRLVLLVEETGVPRENHKPKASHWQTLSHNVVSCTPCHEHYGFQVEKLGCSKFGTGGSQLAAVVSCCARHSP